MNCTNEWSMSAAAKLLGKQNRKVFGILNLAHWKIQHEVPQRQKGNGNCSIHQ